MDTAVDFHILVRGLVNFTLLVATIWFIVAGIVLVVKKTSNI